MLRLSVLIARHLSKDHIFFMLILLRQNFFMTSRH